MWAIIEAVSFADWKPLLFCGLMKGNSFKSASLLVTVLVCLAYVSGNCEQQTTSDEENEVVSLAITDLIEGAGPPAQVILAADTDSPPDRFRVQAVMEERLYLQGSRSKRQQEFLEFKKVLSAEALTDFDRANQKSLRLNKLKILVPLVLLSNEEFNELDAQLTREAQDQKTSYWEQLRARYPGAIGKFNVSRPGFNSNRDQALIYVAYVSGGEGGEGEYVLLEKEDDKWKFRARLIAWMS